MKMVEFRASLVMVFIPLSFVMIFEGLKYTTESLQWDVFVGGGAAVFISAMILWNRVEAKIKTDEEIEKQKESIKDDKLAKIIVILNAIQAKLNR